MADIHKEVDKTVQSEEFINYCDNELLEFAVSYVDYIFSNYSEKGKIERGEVVEYERISTTQARAIRNIALQELTTPGELKRLTSNRKDKKETNKKYMPIWEGLDKLFDSAADSWQAVTGVKKLTPKQFVDNHLPPDLTNNEKKDFNKNLYAHLLKSFCIHFDAHYRYKDTLTGGKTRK